MNSNLQKISFWEKTHIDLIMLIFIILLIAYSIIITWSASNQNFDILEHKIIQIIVGFVLMFITAQYNPRIYNYYSPYLYVICIILLLVVIIHGQMIKGAQRWLNLGFIRFQPSEIAKISVPLVVAHFVSFDYCISSLKKNLISLILIFLPTILVACQPDLGTAILILISGLFVLFLSGISWKLIITLFGILLICIPIIWFFLLHDYQKNRIVMLLNPEIDPLGSGYHIIQSKIAIGSGGIFGKGLLKGSQSQLEFLPERHTDFIFAVLGEELGLIGIVILFTLYLGLILRGLFIAIKTQSMFGKIIVSSFTLTLFIYIFVNVAMVSGILPIVGIPLPLISYGGSSFIVLMISFGIIMSVYTHKNVISRNL